MIGITELEVTEQDIDELGHVNNKVYFSYLEIARENWLKDATGMDFQEMTENNLGTVVIRIEINFKKEAVLGDKITVKTIPERVGNTSFVFKQEIYNQNGELLSDAIVTEVMFDPTRRKSIPVIEDIRKHFNP